jgi:hypothetical protein
MILTSPSNDTGTRGWFDFQTQFTRANHFEIPILLRLSREQSDAEAQNAAFCLRLG